MEFGELNITASRAFWDDYENVDDQPTESIEVKWKWTENHSIEDFKKLENFIVLEGERIRSQINQHNTGNIIPICQLTHQKVFIYWLKDKNAAICLSEETNLNTFGMIAESIADLINSSTVPDVNVVTVNVLPTSAYKIGNDESLEGDLIIRGLNCDVRTAVSELAEPNILTGITAAFASHRHHSNKSFSSYVIYKDSHKINFISSPMVMKFFEVIGVSSNTFYETYSSDSSLYT